MKNFKHLLLIPIVALLLFTNSPSISHMPQNIYDLETFADYSPIEPIETR